MFKYVRFTPVESQFTTLTFKKINEDVKVNFFSLAVVSLEADNEALIDELISSQVKEIKCEVITKEEFINLIKLTSQYKRIIERGNEKLEKLTASTVYKIPFFIYLNSFTSLAIKLLLINYTQTLSSSCPQAIDVV